MNTLRVIIDGPQTGAVNMQRDTDMLEAWRPGQDPILRLYRWRPYAVSYGFHQKPEDFDTESIERLGFGLAKRPTGGRAILHAEELTYCVVGASPSDLFGDSLHSCYMKINEALVAFLRELGLDVEISGGEDRSEMRQAVCFKSAGQHEIRVGGRKIVGSAQRRTDQAFLQHGSILAGPRHADLLECLTERRRGKLSREQLLDVTCDLGRLRGEPYTDKELDNLEEQLAQVFCRVLGLTEQRLRWEDLNIGS